jgi:hypothetical protein
MLAEPFYSVVEKSKKEKLTRDKSITLKIVDCSLLKKHILTYSARNLQVKA